MLFDILNISYDFACGLKKIIENRKTHPLVADLFYDHVFLVDRLTMIISSNFN